MAESLILHSPGNRDKQSLALLTSTQNAKANRQLCKLNLEFLGKSRLHADGNVAQTQSHFWKQSHMLGNLTQRASQMNG